MTQLKPIACILLIACLCSPGTELNAGTLRQKHLHYRSAEYGTLCPPLRFSESDSGSHAISRRTFLSYLGLGGLFVTLIPGGLGAATEPAQNLSAAEMYFLRELEAHNQLVGSFFDQTILCDLSPRRRNDPRIRLFIHYLDSSEWFEAADLIVSHEPFFKNIWALVPQRKNILDIMLNRLAAIHYSYRCWATHPDYYLHFTEGGYPVFEDYQTGFYAGKEDLDFFTGLHRINMLNFQPAYTPSGVPIYCFDPHNWSYFFAKNQRQGPLATKRKKRIKVTLDAHRDLSGSVNKGQPTSKESLASLHMNKDRRLTAELIQQIGVASFNIPALYEGEFDELVMAIPEESQETARENYLPPYGTYELYIGRSKEAPDKLLSFSPLPGTQQESGLGNQREMRLIMPWHQDLNSWKELVTDVTIVPVHLVSPTAKPAGRNRSYLQQLVAAAVNEGAEIVLDIDLDYLGAKVPRGDYRGNAPKYRTSKQRFEELLGVLDQFKDIESSLNAIMIARSREFTDKLDERMITERVIRLFSDPGQRPPWFTAELNRSVLTDTMKALVPGTGTGQLSLLSLLSLQNNALPDRSI